MKKILLVVIFAAAAICASAQTCNHHICGMRPYTSTDTMNLKHCTSDAIPPCCENRREVSDSACFRRDISPSTLIIYFEGNNKRVLKAAGKIGAEVIYTYNIINAVAVRKPDDWTLERTKEYFEKVKGVLQVSYDRIYHLD